MNKFSVTWVFRNDHIWSKYFEFVDDRDQFVLTTGLVTHPDIVQVTIQDGYNERDLKRVY